MQAQIKTLIDISKQKYNPRISQKSESTSTNTKCFWSLLKMFLNNKEIPCIPPLYHDDKFVCNFKEKSKIFNNNFAQQCSVINKNSTVPERIINQADASLAKIVFTTDDIANIIKNLDSNKSHGHDDISIRMLKICGLSICKSLKTIFRTCLNHGKFPEEWKKANVVPVFNKGDKQGVKNYRPVSLLTICSKIFERIIYNNACNYLVDNNLISQNQSGFKRGDSCINQLISVTHDLLNSLDEGLEVRVIFLDISKAFDKVWHERLIYKLQQNCISSELLNILVDFLKNRKQRVVLSGQSSNWIDVKAGVPRGSIMGPLLFLIYINDLPEGLINNAKLFADDMSLFLVVWDIAASTEELNNELRNISKCAYQWKMNFNPDLTKQAQEVIFSRKLNKPVHPYLLITPKLVKLNPRNIIV